MLSQWLSGRNDLIFLPRQNTGQLYPSFLAMFIFPPLLNISLYPSVCVCVHALVFSSLIKFFGLI